MYLMCAILMGAEYKRTSRGCLQRPRDLRKVIQLPTPIVSTTARRRKPRGTGGDPSRLAPRREEPRGVCPRCARPANVNPKRPVCQACRVAIHQAAATAQERDYLAAWLFSRVDAAGQPFADSVLTATPGQLRHIARCVDMARAAHVDWTRPPAPIPFDTRLSDFLAAALAGSPGAPTMRRRRGRPPTTPTTATTRQGPHVAHSHMTAGALALDAIEEGPTHGG